MSRIKHRTTIRRAQNTVEYVILVSLAVAATFAMNTYLERATGSKIDELTDEKFDPQNIIPYTESDDNIWNRYWLCWDDLYVRKHGNLDCFQNFIGCAQGCHGNANVFECIGDCHDARRACARMRRTAWYACMQDGPCDETAGDICPWDLPAEDREDLD